MYEAETQYKLKALGIGHRFYGYTAVFDAVQLALEDEDRLLSFHGRILDELAARYQRKSQNIERNIRTISLHAWQTNPEYLSKLAGYPLVKPPSVVELIDILSTSIAREHMKSFRTK